MSIVRAPVDPDAGLVDALCRRVEHVPGDVGDVVRRHVRDVAPLVDPVDAERLIAAAVSRLAGLDVLDALLADPDVDEVLVNRGGEVWIERRGELHRGPVVPRSSLPRILERVLAPTGRRLDRSNPIVDARLPDGSRVCAVVEPVAVDGAAISIRRAAQRVLPLEAFTSGGTLDLLREVVEARCNVVVTGATSAGKTALLAALLDELDAGERVVLIEDTSELAPSVDNLVRLEARSATPDGLSEISLAELVRTALRLRPDRLVVGEVRGVEVLGLVQAMNTGHDGSMSTCHANGAVDALLRLEALLLHAAPAWPLAAIRSHLSRSIDIVIEVRRGPGGARHVAAVAEVVTSDEAPAVRLLADTSGVVAGLRRERT